LLDDELEEHSREETRTTVFEGACVPGRVDDVKFGDPLLRLWLSHDRERASRTQSSGCQSGKFDAAIYLWAEDCDPNHTIPLGV
jgi:hypothetical protein